MWGSIMDYRISQNVRNVKPSAIREIFKFLSVPGLISFAAGNPSPESFPTEAMQKASDAVFQNSASAALQYGTTEGYTPLRDWVKNRLINKFSSFTEVVRWSIFASIIYENIP